MIRHPVVAGTFYPADKTSLINQINSFLEKAEKVKPENSLRILIVPHAGYDYSGQTAAWGFKQLEKTNFTRIILIGVSHQAYFENAVVYNQGFWQTPLGKVKIDEDFAITLINQSNLIEANLNAHQQEHSLEVELPFLQQVLKDFKIVPILLGQSDDRALEEVAEKISNNFNKQTLLVISSDLSHYPAYNIANQVDKKTIDAILTGDAKKFNQAVEKGLNQPGVDTCACGADAIKVGMMVAKNLNIKDIKLLNYVNSGDLHGDKNRVVGYASIGFYSDKKTSNAETLNSARGGDTEATEELSKSQQKRLLDIARQTLESYLKNKIIPEFKIPRPRLGSAEGEQNSTLQKKLGAFVTLKTKTGQLRGCIGEFEPKKPLYKVVQDKTIDAALHDPRFDKVKYEDLKNINIEISVLSQKKKINDWQKIELGKHGVVIKKGLRAGTFLPQVAKEASWNLEAFLSTLCSNKASLSSDCYKDPKTEIFIFTAQVFHD